MQKQFNTESFHNYIELFLGSYKIFWTFKKHLQKSPTTENFSWNLLGPYQENTKSVMCRKLPQVDKSDFQ